MHGWVRCENDLQREVNFFRKNSARPEDRRRAHHRYTRGEGAGCVHNLGVSLEERDLDPPVWSKKSCGLPVVVLQEAAQSLFAAHFAIAGTHPLFSCWKEQNISSTLMVSLSMVVLGERRYRSPQ